MNKRSLLKLFPILAVFPALTVKTMTNSHAQGVSKIAVVYFSLTGNTESVARAVQYATGADIFRIETVDPYSSDYNSTTKVVKEEIENHVLRPIKPVPICLENYETIVLASPTWWHHIASPLQTWIRSVNLDGKFVLTCNTHGGGGLMHTREDFEKLLPNSKLGTHYVTYGSVSLKSIGVHNWLKENGLRLVSD